MKNATKKAAAKKKAAGEEKEVAFGVPQGTQTPIAQSEASATGPFLFPARVPS